MDVIKNSRRSLFSLIYLVIGLTTVLNSMWMIALPMSWYTGLPAVVPDTGPFNAHFIRDLGVAAFIVGIGALWCARNVDRCGPIHVAITLYFTGHALIHVGDILSGNLPIEHWLIDLPVVFGTAITLLALTPAILKKTSKTSAL